MRIHFIAIGGSAMHNLAIALHKKGLKVTGSDDEIFEPSRSRLQKYGLLPEKKGWHPELITDDIEAIILGMHARSNNPELLKAKELGLKIYSYPEYLYEQTKNKTRVVIGGSHGKTTTTSMVMHVLKYLNIDFDYMVGANLEGFETMVGLNKTSKIAVFEGDEYLSSPVDRRPKFLHYRPHIALLTGIAWDHINVFPTFENYIYQFRLFSRSVENGGVFIYFGEDKILSDIASDLGNNIQKVPYYTPTYLIKENTTSLLDATGIVPLKIFGEHNLQNLAGAKKICQELGISDEQFFNAISSFKGSARRLEVIGKNDSTVVFYDFAHSPSKLKATIRAVKEQFRGRKLVAVMELHTFSSLKKEFLPQYKGTMSAADRALIYFDRETIKHKQLDPITPEMVKKAFGDNVEVYTNVNLLFGRLNCGKWEESNLLIMSSGNFSGFDVKQFAQKLITA